MTTFVGTHPLTMHQQTRLTLWARNDLPPNRRAAEHVRAQFLATTTPVIAARPDYKEGLKP